LSRCAEKEQRTDKDNRREDHSGTSQKGGEEPFEDVDVYFSGKPGGGGSAGTEGEKT